MIFWPYLGTVKCQISRSSRGFAPAPSPELCPEPAGGLTAPQTPQLHKAMIFGLSLSCHWHNKTQLKLVTLKVSRKTMLGTLDVSKRSFKAWHTSLSSCHSNFISGCFLSMITNHILQSYHQLIAMQWKLNHWQL